MADLAARHTALDGSDLLIKCARTYAPTISMGALLGFVRFKRPRPGELTSPCPSSGGGVGAQAFSIQYCTVCFYTALNIN